MSTELSYIYISPSDWADLFNAISNLIAVLVGVFGRTATGIILLLLLISAIVYRRWREHKKGEAQRAVIDEKERTIQRLAEENRNYRIVILKQVAGWTNDEIELFVMKNEFKDGVVARKVLEGEEEKEDSRQPAQAARRSKERQPRKGRGKG